MLRQVAPSLGGQLAELAVAVEQTVLAVLASTARHPLYANVEYYAGVVMDRCGLPRELFTPTFAVSRVIGWCANILEQANDHQIIRPAARYVGPPPRTCSVPLAPRGRLGHSAMQRQPESLPAVADLGGVGNGEGGVLAALS